MSMRVSLKGAETRKAILDASEILFARHGYHGTSLRDIAHQAGVRLSLVHYHFGNKSDIFSAAMDRKIDALLGVVTASFEAADRDAASRPLTIEDAVAAFILPFFSIAASPSHVLHYYVVMTSHLMSSYRMPELRPILARLSVISDVFEKRITQLMPDTSEADILASIYLIEAALIFMVQDAGFLDDLSREHHSTEALRDMARPSIRFFAAGIEKLANKPL
jgi:AcrR family transcriptional regulator